MLARLEVEHGITPESPAEAPAAAAPAGNGYQTPGSGTFDRLAELVSWADILEPEGWTQVRPPDAMTAEAWHRPGGDNTVSAKVLKDAPYALVVWSEDAGLPPGPDQDLTKARVLAHLHYGGDESALGKALVRGEAQGVPAHVNDVFRASWREPMPTPSPTVLSEGTEAGSEAAEGAFDSYVAAEAFKIRVRDAARELVEAGKRPLEEPFDAGTLGEILARPALPQNRIASLVPWEAGTLIPAQRKTGKTTFIGNLCRSLITGYDFLDRFQVRKVDGVVAILNYEMPGHTLARWLDDIGVPHDRLILINLRARANPLATEQGKAQLASLLRNVGVESVIYDPFGRAYTGKSQNDPGEVGAWLADLDRFTRGDVGAKDLFLPNHAGWDAERSRGASSLEDWADSIITLTKDGDDRYMRAIGRDVDFDEDRLVYDDHRRRLSLAGSGSRKETSEQRKTQQLRKACQEIVKGNPGINGSEISAELKDRGVPHQRDEHRPVLGELVKDGILTFEKGSRGAKKYSVASSPPPESDIPRDPPVGDVSDLPPTPPL